MHNFRIKSEIAETRCVQINSIYLLLLRKCLKPI